MYDPGPPRLCLDPSGNNQLVCVVDPFELSGTGMQAGAREGGASPVPIAVAPRTSVEACDRDHHLPKGRRGARSRHLRSPVMRAPHLQSGSHTQWIRVNTAEVSLCRSALRLAYCPTACAFRDTGGCGWSRVLITVLVGGAG